jgi:putative ABC transport system permease protein
MTTIRVFLLLISALIVGAFFVVLVQQRHAEIALLKAFGASRAYVLRSLLAEVTCLLVPAVAAGCAVAIGAGLLLERTVPFEQRPPSILTAALLLVATGLASVVVTARRAAGANPLLALGGHR